MRAVTIRGLVSARVELSDAFVGVLSATLFRACDLQSFWLACHFTRFKGRQWLKEVTGWCLLNVLAGVNMHGPRRAHN